MIFGWLKPFIPPMKQLKQLSTPIIAKTLALTGFAALSLIHTTPAQAINIDFQSLEQVNGSFNPIGNTYTEKGFTLDALDPNNYGFSIFGTLASGYPGSTALFNNTVNGITRLTQVGGGEFDLASIDLTSLNGNNNVTVGFTGTKADLSTVNQSFTTENLLSSLETFTFNNITGKFPAPWGA